MDITSLWRSTSSAAIRGFTLVEMLVVMAIFVILTTVTLANNSQFGGRITLETLAYDIALSVRQAQVYGIAVQRFGDTGSDFGRGYGVHFETASPATYQLFADTFSGDGIYNDGELVRETTLRGGYRIVDLCIRSNGTETCGIAELDILYKRPEPDAYIRANSGAQLYEAGRIILESPRTDRKSILIEVAGQIAVQ